MRSFLVALALVAGCAHMPPPPTLHGVVMPVNFECWLHQRADGTGACVAYRGGQPTEAQLATMGVRSVIKLNLAAEGRDRLPAGVEPFEHPWSPVGPVSHDDTLAALYDLEHAPRPLYTHCSHGADRTGYLIAVYRVLVEHKPPSIAWAEWRRFPREVTDKLFLYSDFERETGFRVPDGER